jgi:hypothetical protein
MSHYSTTIDELRARGKPVLLLFANPAENGAREWFSKIATWQEMNDDPVTIAMAAPSGTKRSEIGALARGVAVVLDPADDALQNAYRVTCTPAAVVIKANGEVVGPPSVGLTRIEQLFDAIARSAGAARAQRLRREQATTSAIGERSPDVALPDLAELHQRLLIDGQSQILLFWNPNCGYCRQLSPAIRACAQRNEHFRSTTTLVVRGSADENRTEGLGMRTLLDQGLSATMAFGVDSTPSAIRVDANGLIASPMARGVREVRTLLGLDTRTSPAEPIRLG